MISDKCVLWVDEIQKDLDSYLSLMKEIFGDEVTVIPEIPPKHIEDLLDKIITSPDLVAIVLDQKLKETGEVFYNGVEAAEGIRRINSKIPIYILTNYESDPEISESEYNVEQIIEKGLMDNEDYIKNMSAKIRRHLNIYQDIVSEREIRFDVLLRKSLEDNLDEKESEEFQELDFWRKKPLLASDEPEAAKLKQLLDQQAQELEDLKEDIEANLKESDESE